MGSKNDAHLLWSSLSPKFKSVPLSDCQWWFESKFPNHLIFKTSKTTRINEFTKIWLHWQQIPVSWSCKLQVIENGQGPGRSHARELQILLAIYCLSMSDLSKHCTSASSGLSLYTRKAPNLFFFNLSSEFFCLTAAFASVCFVPHASPFIWHFENSPALLLNQSIYATALMLARQGLFVITVLKQL